MTSLFTAPETEAALKYATDKLYRQNPVVKILMDLINAIDPMIRAMAPTDASYNAFSKHTSKAVDDVLKLYQDVLMTYMDEIDPKKL